MALAEDQIAGLIDKCRPKMRFEDLGEASGDEVLAIGQRLATTALLGDQDAVYSLIGSVSSRLLSALRRAAAATRDLSKVRSRRPAVSSRAASGSVEYALLALGQGSDLAVSYLEDLAREASAAGLESSDRDDARRYASELVLSVLEAGVLVRALRRSMPTYAALGGHRMYSEVSESVRSAIVSQVGAAGALSNGIADIAATASSVLAYAKRGIDYNIPKVSSSEPYGPFSAVGDPLPNRFEGDVFAVSDGEYVTTCTIPAAAPAELRLECLYGSSLSAEFSGAHPTTFGSGSGGTTYDLSVRPYIVPASLQISVDGDVFIDNGLGVLLSISGWSSITGSVNYTTGSVILEYGQIIIGEVPLGRVVQEDAPFYMSFRSYLVTPDLPLVFTFVDGNTVNEVATPPFLYATVSSLLSVIGPQMGAFGASLVDEGAGSATLSTGSLGSSSRIAVPAPSSTPALSNSLTGSPWDVAPDSVNALFTRATIQSSGSDVAPEEFVLTGTATLRPSISSYGDYESQYHRVILSEGSADLLEASSADSGYDQVTVLGPAGRTVHAIIGTESVDGQLYFRLDTPIPLLVGDVSAPLTGAEVAFRAGTSRLLVSLHSQFIVSAPGYGLSDVSAESSSWLPRTHAGARYPVRVSDVLCIDGTPTECRVLSVSSDGTYGSSPGAPEGHEVWSVGYLSRVSLSRECERLSARVLSADIVAVVEAAANHKLTGTDPKSWERLYTEVLPFIESSAETLSALKWPRVEQVAKLLDVLASSGLSWLSTSLLDLDWSSLTAGEAPALSQSDASEYALSALRDTYGRPGAPDVTVGGTVLDDYGI